MPTRWWSSRAPQASTARPLATPMSYGEALHDAGRSRERCPCSSPRGSGIWRPRSVDCPGELRATAATRSRVGLRRAAAASKRG
jgi:hypothetical protein